MDAGENSLGKWDPACLRRLQCCSRALQHQSGRNARPVWDDRQICVTNHREWKGIRRGERPPGRFRAFTIRRFFVPCETTLVGYGSGHIRDPGTLVIVGTDLTERAHVKE